MKKILLLAAAALVSMASHAGSMYLFGELGEGWNPGKGTQMTETSAGVFTYDYEATAAKTAYFGLVTELDASGWDGQNAHRFGPAGASSITLGEPSDWKDYVPDNTWNIKLVKGNTYHIVADTNKSQLTITIKGEEIEAETATVAIVGGFNNWSTTANSAVVNLKKGEETASIDVIYSNGDVETGEGFKVVIDGLYLVNADRLAELNVPTIVDQASGEGDNMLLDVEDNTPLVFTVNVKTKQLTITSAAAISNVNADASAAKVYYNVKGQEVSNPSGIVIVKQGNKVTKEYVK